MVSLVFALTLSFAQLAPAPVETQAVYEARILEALRSCGIKTPPRRFEYDDLLQSYALDLDSPDLTPANVECLANTPALDGPVITFADPAFYEIHAEVRSSRPDIREHTERMLAEQRAWLAERGLLDGAPGYDPAQPASTYAAALESHCGLTPGLFLAADDQARTVSIMGDGDPSLDQFQCVFALISLTEVEGTVTGVLVGEDSEP